MRGQQRIGFAHLLTRCVEKWLDYAVFEKNSLRMLAFLIWIGACLSEKSKNPRNVQRFGSEFSQCLVEVSNGKLLVMKIGTCLRRETGTDRLISAITKKCCPGRIRSDDRLPHRSPPAFPGARPESALRDDALLERAIAQQSERQ